MTYTTIQGDTWDGISYKVYGTGAHMSRLIYANQQHANISVFGADVILTVPDVPIETAAGLPPWRQL